MENLISKTVRIGNKAQIFPSKHFVSGEFLGSEKGEDAFDWMAKMDRGLFCIEVDDPCILSQVVLILEVSYNMLSGVSLVCDVKRQPTCLTFLRFPNFCVLQVGLQVIMTCVYRLMTKLETCLKHIL